MCNLERRKIGKKNKKVDLLTVMGEEVLLAGLGEVHSIVGVG